MMAAAGSPFSAVSNPAAAVGTSGLPDLDFGETAAFLSAALVFGDEAGAAFCKPESESDEPGSLEPESLVPVRVPVLGEDDEPPKYVVQATMSRSRLMWSTACPSVYSSVGDHKFYFRFRTHWSM